MERSVWSSARIISPLLRSPDLPAQHTCPFYSAAERSNGARNFTNERPRRAVLDRWPLAHAVDYGEVVNVPLINAPFTANSKRFSARNMTRFFVKKCRRLIRRTIGPVSRTYPVRFAGLGPLAME